MRSSKLLVWEKIASGRDFLCVSGDSSREAGNKSTLTCPEETITGNSYMNRQWVLQSKSQNWCELSQLSSGEVTRRNPRLCLFFVDKNLHWWLCLNMQENQSYCLKKPFPVAETQSWTSSCFKFCCQLIDENPYSTWKSEKQRRNLISFRVWKNRNQSQSTRESFSVFLSTWFFQNPAWFSKASNISNFGLSS